MAVQSAFQLGVNQCDRRGTARGGGDQRIERRARAAQVLGRAIHDGLSVGHVMDRGDRAMFDANALMQHLDHRGEAIRRAACRRHDAVPCRLINLVIDAVNNIGRIAILDRGGHDDLLDARRKVRRDLGLGLENTGAVDHNINACQGQVAEVARADKRQARAVDDHRIIVMVKSGVPAPMHRIEFEQMGVHGGIAHRVVDPGYVGPPRDQRLEDQLADPPKTVDGIDRHAPCPAPCRAMSSTAACRLTRSNVSMGSAAKAVIRLRSAP